MNTKIGSSGDADKYGPCAVIDDGIYTNYLEPLAAEYPKKTIAGISAAGSRTIVIFLLWLINLLPGHLHVIQALLILLKLKLRSIIEQNYRFC